MMSQRLSGRVLVVILALVAAACGGDDGAGDETTTTAGEQTTTTTAATTTTTTAPAPTTTTIAEVSGDSDSRWCQAVRAAQEDDGESPLNFNPFALTDPATAEQTLTEFLENIEMFEDLAPPEIEDDVGTVVGAFRSFYDIVAAAGFDVLALSEDDLAGLDDPALETAASNIDTYSTEVCGVDFDQPVDPTAGGGDDPVAIVLAALGLPPGMIPEEVQECVLTTLLEQNPEFVASIGPGYVPSETDVALLLETAAGCGFSLG